MRNRLKFKPGMVNFPWTAGICAVHDVSQDGVWFFILPCDWRFLPELGPPPD